MAEPLWLTVTLSDPTTAPHSGIPLGQTVSLVGTFADEDGTPTDPVAIGTCSFKSPVTGATTVITPTQEIIGQWAAVLPSPTEAGLWLWYWITGDATPAASSGAFLVIPKPF